MLFGKKSNSSVEKTLSDSGLRRSLHKNLGFAALEQYKLLRTNLSFILPDEDADCPVIGITSSMRGEGKSTTAVNLSYVLAENGKRVLLLDGDLRIPSVAKKMGVKSSPGLTDLLVDYDHQTMENFRSELLENWYIVPSGKLPPNPPELLGSHKMEKLLDTLRGQFDYIIIDLPPVNIVSDALAISHLITGIIMVVREEYTEKKEFETAVRELRLSDVNLLGCVMNVTRASKTGYGKYRYRRYKKYYSYQNYYTYQAPPTENPDEGE